MSKSLGFSLGIALAALLAAPSSSAQSAPGTQASVSFVSVSGVQGGTGTCPDGSTPLEHSESGCIPANCGALKVLNWGVPTPEVVSIPKFDSGLGTLLQVELTAKVRHAGNFCVDNTSPSCAVVDFTPSVQVLVTPNASLPGVQPISVNQAVTIFTPGFNLGGMDGIDDCATPTGPMSIGNCAPGEDHFITQFDENYSSPPTLLMTAAQLAPWINTPGGPAEYEASVRFDAWAQGIITGSGSSNVDISVSDFARLELEAKYIYCPNMAPDCVPANPGYTVSENPIAANNSININLMDLVSDMDGCIDCSTFQITQQPLAADAPLSTSCTGLGDLINPKAGCTTCTTCIVTYTPGVGADFCGTDSFKFKVSDDKGAERECEVFITVNPVNERPFCVPGPALDPMLQGTQVARDFRPYVDDPDNGPDGSPDLPNENCGDPIDYSTMSLSNNDGLTFQAIPSVPGAFRITAPASFCGLTEIEVNVCDSGAPSLCIDPPGPLCTVTIEVTAMNEPPVCVQGPALPDVVEGQVVQVDLRPYVADPDDLDGCGAGIDNTSITATSQCGGSFTPVGGQPGVFNFTAPTDFCGPCQITVNACDLGTPPLCIDPPGRPCVLTINVLPENEPPVCVSGPPLPSVEEGDTVRIDFTSYVADPDDADGCGDGIDNASITPTSLCGGSFAAVAGQPGVWDFTAPTDFCGTCDITLTACDLGTPPLCISQPCMLTITIDPANEPPVCVPGPSLGTVDQGVTIEIDFNPYVADPDDTDGCGSGLDVGSITPASQCGGSFAPVQGQPGVFNFTAPMDQCGPCQITVTACDLANPPLCIDQPCVLSIEINGINQPPVCVNGPALDCILEDGSMEIDLTQYVSDPDDITLCGAPLDPSTFVVTSECGAEIQPVGGPTGRFLITPPANFCGPCDLSFTVQDTEGLPVEGGPCVIMLEVCPVNDPPVAMDDYGQVVPGESIIIDLCANDSDIDDGTGCGCLLDCSSIEIIGGGVSDCGTLERTNPDNSAGDFTWTFTPAPGFENDTCCFDYRIWDRDPNTGLLCDFDEAEVCIFVSDDCIETSLRQPSSLLLYPEFDNRPGMLTIHSVTNTSFTDSIRVKLEYVNAEDCTVADRSLELTPNDTCTFATNLLIAEQVRGFGYMYAQCGQTGPPVVFNQLIGNMLVMDGYDAISFAVNAVGFRGIENPDAPIASCGRRETDLNGNGVRDFDGIEYDPVPDRILIPRFLGQTPDRQNELILIGLSGGQKFTTTLEFLVYNDNEDVFSRQHSFYCWERSPLQDISNLFENDWLATTDNDPDEVLGATATESGWMRINGGVATSSTTSIPDPAFYAVLIEVSDIGHLAADLPFGDCSQDNGGLLPRSLNGEF